MTSRIYYANFHIQWGMLEWVWLVIEPRLF